MFLIRYFSDKIGTMRRNRIEYLKNKEEARSYIIQRLRMYSDVYGFKFNRVSIRNQKTRWGSCSKKGNLNFNYRILKLPNHLAEYIIIHELCHLKEFNHSKRFWNLVAQIMSGYLESKRELKSIRII